MAKKDAKKALDSVESIDMADEEIQSTEKVLIAEVKPDKGCTRRHPKVVGFRVESDEALANARALVAVYEEAKLGTDRDALKAAKMALNELRLTAPEAVAKARDEALEAIEAAKK